jgi:gas vesicle protein
MVGFVVGALAGGLAVLFWGEEMRRFAATKTRRIRASAADTLKAVEETAENVLDRTKEQVTSTLEAGRDAIRPSGPLVQGQPAAGDRDGDAVG